MGGGGVHLGTGVETVQQSLKKWREGKDTKDGHVSISTRETKEDGWGCSAVGDWGPSVFSGVRVKGDGSLILLVVHQSQ